MFIFANKTAQHAPWNKGKLTGQKPPLLPKHVWAIRTKLHIDGRVRDLALFNLAIDSKLRGCDLVSLRAGDIPVDVPTAPWHWNTAQQFATGPGIAFFTASNCYAHGGLSIQECLTPDLQIERAEDTRERASIESVIWKGMRCFVVATDCSAGVQADLRLATPAGASVAASTKTLDEDGSTSLLLEDDKHESADLVVVLLGIDGNVLAQHKTKVGIDS